LPSPRPSVDGERGFSLLEKLVSKHLAQLNLALTMLLTESDDVCAGINLTARIIFAFNCCREQLQQLTNLLTLDEASKTMILHVDATLTARQVGQI
jgi:hypothetical protein